MEDLQCVVRKVSEGGPLNLGTLIAAGPSLTNFSLCGVLAEDSKWARKTADILRLTSFGGPIFPKLSKLSIHLELPPDTSFAGEDSIVGLSELRDICEERKVQLVFFTLSRPSV